MITLTRRATLLSLCSFTMLSAATAAPTRYKLDKNASKVGFQFSLNGLNQTGTMPVSKADIIVDPANLAASRVDVTLNVAGAQTALPFATQALVGPEVLDARQFPTIRFVSTLVMLAKDGRLSGGARIRGRLTMHGKTRPITLDANLYRARGSAVDDLETLTVLLAGQVSRSAFGASGYADLVEDMVSLNITAVIRAGT